MNVVGRPLRRRRALGDGHRGPRRDRRRPGGGQRVGARRPGALAAGHRAGGRAAPAPRRPVGRPVVGAAGPRARVRSSPGCSGAVAAVALVAGRRTPSGWRSGERAGCSSTPGTGWGVHALPAGPCSRCRSASSSSRRWPSGACCGGCSRWSTGRPGRPAVTSVLFGLVARASRRRRGRARQRRATSRWHGAPSSCAGGRHRGLHDRGRRGVRGAAPARAAACSRRSCCTGRPTGSASSPRRWRGRCSPGLSGRAAQSSWNTSHRTLLALAHRVG